MNTNQKLHLISNTFILYLYRFLESIIPYNGDKLR